MHCSRRLIVQTLVFSRSYLHRQVSPPETLIVKGGTTWARNGRWIFPENALLPRNIQGSFTCRKSTTWDKRFTSLPREGVLRIFSSWKIRRVRQGLNPRTCVPKASTLPLDHRSRFLCKILHHLYREGLQRKEHTNYITFLQRHISKWLLPELYQRFTAEHIEVKSSYLRKFNPLNTKRRPL